MINKITGAENIRWDLSQMYKSIDDFQLDQDVLTLNELRKQFNLAHKGKLTSTLSTAIKEYSVIEELEGKIILYLSLLQSEDVTNTAVKTKMAEVEQILSNSNGEYMTFFQLELVAIEDQILAEFYAKDPYVARHRPWLEYIRIYKPHLLSEPVESAITKRSPFGVNAWSDFFDEFEADLEIPWNKKKKTLTEMLHILTNSDDRTERDKALTAINKTLAGHFAKYSAQTLYMVAGSNAVEGRERSYKNPMDARNKSNRISDEVVDVLHRVIQEVAGPLVRRHYRLKAKLLGLKKLRWSDRNAPMPFSDTNVVPFTEATKTVLAAYQDFSPILAGLVQRFFDEKRIDAPGVKGKRAGAFNYSLVLPNNEPTSYVLLNYLGSNRDVTTLAHELGHGVHGFLAGKAQGVLMAHAPIAFCETASVFGEMTTFNFLKKRLLEQNDKKSLLALLIGKIDDMMNTVVRQMSFSNFERRLHGMDGSYATWKDVKKLSVEDLNKIWITVTKEFYGEDGDVFTYQDVEHLWSYIGHFHRPFYVYGYAFGELLTQSIYAQRQKIGNQFEPLYLDMLRSGSTRNAVELLKPFSLDPTDEKFWRDGINNGMGTMIGEAERLARELGLVN